MNDRRAHFLTMTGDTCTAAALANIEVELTLSNGTTTTGVPAPRPSREPDAALEQTGYANLLLVDGAPILLEDVIGFSVRTP